MTTYHYSKATEPSLDKIHADVAASDMTDKSIQWCRWDEEEADLEVVFQNELSTGDKAILDGIVAGV